ncbi:MAG TPA: MFS transporter, partial [Hyphomicrobiaceae bacterium]|nr:MFS transporter [Hyphomicrobiaceae bacterium]
AEPALSPTMVATALGLIGALASLSGNELATRYGRRRLIFTAMLGSILIGSMIGFVAPLSYPLAVALMFVYGLVIWLDSSSLTAGTAGSAEPSRRGATLAVHSMLGYTGGFIGPLIIGWTLDAAGANSPTAWGMAFAAIALLMVLALAVFAFMRPRGLPGDRDHDAKPD